MREQEGSGMSDARFAQDVLGVSPALWCLAKKGRRQPGARLIAGALRAYPELTTLIGAALAAPSRPLRRSQALAAAS